MATLPPPRPQCAAPFPRHTSFPFTPPSFPQETPKLAQWHTSYSFRLNGPTRQTQGRSSEALKELGEALSEIDGWMAGTEFLDSRDRQKARQSPVYAWDVPNPSPDSPYPQSLDSFFDDNCPPGNPPAAGSPTSVAPCPSLSGESTTSQEAQAPPPPPPPPGRPKGCTEDQWAALQVVRDGLNLHYRNLEKLRGVESPHREAIEELLEVYARPDILRKAGFLTLRNVLTDATPTELPEIFAFAAVSYTLGSLLHKTGCMHESRVLGGLAEWRDAIDDASGRQAFEFLARELWPEANSRLDSSHCEPTNYASLNTTNTHGQPYSFYGSEAASYMDGQLGHLPFPDTPIQGCGGRPQNGMPMDTMFLINTSQQGFQMRNWRNQHTPMTYDPYIQPGYYHPDVSYTQEAVPPMSTTPFMPGQFPLGLSPPVLPPQIPVSSLRDTDMVKVIFWYHERFSRICDLLHKLSGDGISSWRRQTVRGKTSADMKIAKFHGQMVNHLFAPLAKKFPSGVESMLLETTEAMVLDWSLRSLRETQEYLLTLCKAFLPSETNKEKSKIRHFLRAILNQCLSASQDMNHFVYPAHVASDSDVMNSRYSGGYIQQRLRSVMGDLGVTVAPEAGRKRKWAAEYSEDADGQVPVCRGRPSKTFASTKTGGFVCPGCKYAFATSNGLKRHLHPDGHFVCDVPGCDKEFNRSDNLKSHRKAAH